MAILEAYNEATLIRCGLSEGEGLGTAVQSATFIYITFANFAHIKSTRDETAHRLLDFSFLSQLPAFDVLIWE